jgi:hypothetical protein
MEMDVRICPQCDAEYRPEIATCAHCEVPTVSRWEIDKAVVGKAVRQLMPSAELVGLRTAELTWIRDLAQLLAEDDVASRIEEAGGGCGGGSCQYTLLVRPEDVEQAQRVDVEYLRGQVPDMPAGAGPVAADRCPACGAAVPARAVECPDCGLVVGELEGLEEAGAL